jgi:hypothetical protein
MAPMWEDIDHDTASGRRIYKADEDSQRSSNYGTYDFRVTETFEVRNANGPVLLELSGSESGEYWCGLFVWFVEGSEGRRVRLDASDQETDQFFEVPDLPTRVQSRA